MQVLLREKLVVTELAAAKLGIHEIGGNNHGPAVAKFLAEVGLPQGFAWCAAFQSYELHQVAGHHLPIESASVGQIYAYAAAHGWSESTPKRGDLVCYSWEGHAPFGDHIGLVVAASSLPGAWKLTTVEGNTSSGVAGSQGDGDGVFLRTRIVSKGSVGFVRIPGYIEEPVPSKTAIAKPTLVKSGTTKPVAKTPAKKTPAKAIAKKRTSAAPKKKSATKRRPKK